METQKKSKRLYSLDALRGFDMLMISGAGMFIYLMHGLTNNEWLNAFALQMEHSEWGAALTIEDFIFPLFLFISGISLSFSVNSQVTKGVPNAKIYKKAFTRMLLLILLGFVYKNSPIDFSDPSQLRYSSVLGRIGIATFLTTILYVNFSWQKRLFWVAGILMSYYAAMFLIPVPGFGAGNFTMEGSLMGWIDRAIMPGLLKDGVYDELAIATSLPAVTLTIIGAWVGDILRNHKTNSTYKIKILTIMGISLIVVGWAWGLHFPIVKKLWSGSFILLTAGASVLSMVLFYWLIDVKNYTKWAFPLNVVGLNSLLIYFVYRFVDFGYTSWFLFSGFYEHGNEQWFEVYKTFGGLVLVWLFLYFMYRKKLFLKI